MKKHLIAAAVAAAVVAPAMAQDVSIYGRLDAGYSDLETKAGAQKTSQSAITFSPFLTSRWGMRGSEDLGGGLKANFLIESQLAGERATTANTQVFGGRGMWVELAGGFGSVRAGIMDTATKGLYDAFDVGYSNNVRGTLAKTLGGIVGQRDVAVRYSTPTVNGFSGSAALMKNDDKRTGAANPADDYDFETANGHELGLAYAAGPLNVRAVYRQAKTKNDGSATIAGTIGGTVLLGANEADDFVTVANAVETKTKSTALGASYNLGAALVSAQYWDTKASPAAGNSTDNKYFYIGVRVPLGVVTAFASVIDGEQKVGANKDDRDGYQLGALYGFSKRTNGYVAYGNDKVKAGANETKATQMAVGIVHTF